MTDVAMYSDLTMKIVQGVHAGALEAINVARRTQTDLVIWRDGKIAHITPDEADAMVKEREAQKAK